MGLLQTIRAHLEANEEVGYTTERTTINFGQRKDPLFQQLIIYVAPKELKCLPTKRELSDLRKKIDRVYTPWDYASNIGRSYSTCLYTREEASRRDFEVKSNIVDKMRGKIAKRTINSLNRFMSTLKIPNVNVDMVKFALINNSRSTYDPYSILFGGLSYSETLAEYPPIKITDDALAEYLKNNVEGKDYSFDSSNKILRDSALKDRFKLPWRNIIIQPVPNERFVSGLFKNEIFFHGKKSSKNLYKKGVDTKIAGRAWGLPRNLILP